MMSISAVSVAIADDLCGRGSSAPRITTKMRGTMARRPHGAKDKISAGPYATRPKQYPTIRSLRIRCGALPASGEVKKGGRWGDVITPGELAAFGNPR